MPRSQNHPRSRSPTALLLLLLLAVQRSPWTMAPSADGGKTLSTAEQQQVQKVVWRKSMAAIAEGNMRPGKELELISALDLGTIPWSHVPRRLKDHLSLPLGDRGIDSLALNLTVAVQAKDYTNGSVPLNRLTNFYFWATASRLKHSVQRLVVATTAGTRLPEDWRLNSGAEQRVYREEELEEWRRRARKEKPPKQLRSSKVDLERWPHQIECLKHCRAFLHNETQRDFFVQIATGGGKSLVMADLLADLGAGQRACVIVPKLDLMEQLAQLLETRLPDRQVSRVGTGSQANLSAQVFVCVRNSAWQLENLTLDLLLLDEAHHYEPVPGNPDPLSDADANLTSGIHARRVLSLKAPKRIFFSATLRNEPDFDFGLRPAITAGVIKDYTVMVPVLTEGDPRPRLVELIKDMIWLPQAFIKEDLGILQHRPRGQSLY
ncbi:unnamed protein product [Durusdinium trenchii]|uniref:Helicase ATP-binding domain-containing protein n=1 Tax=Durusdinium trenchii TaxID=1381693 RepID=A0ABP0MK00_9DINO